MTVFHLTKEQARPILKLLAQETTPILDTSPSATDPLDIPHEPVIIIVD